VVRGDGHVLPRDFVAEVDGELDDARRHLERDRHRVVALEELRRIATAVAADLVRPVTVADVIRSARDPGERERRARLVRLMRGAANDDARSQGFSDPR
jgi:hypothetical protein